MKNKPEQIEVLAPAGGWDSLEAAVRAGADAVYLGGTAFGARASAKNFDREQLRRAVEYCHRRDVRVHVTVNTLLKDSELPEVLDFVEYLCSLPVDAVLVQDMGLLALLRRRAPRLPLHASTQMSLHTPAGVRLARELSLTRAVLARELSLDEIREISAQTDMELESFVHGALCMCVSGQCYLSAMLGGKSAGRSGNRGQCAQPCRLPFAAPGGTGHDLSLKDLTFIESVGRLREAGICSAKIEGRMKRPEYVAAATAACRLAADGEPVPGELSQALRDVFSRSGFTDGYLTGHRGREMFGTRRKEDVEAGGKVLAGLRGLYRAERQSIPVDFSLQVDREQGSVTLTARRKGRNIEGHAAAGVTEHITSRERCEQQLRKTGGTPFCAQSVDVLEDVPLPVSTVNELRREALDALLEAAGRREPVPFQKIPMDFPAHPSRPGKLPVRAVVREQSQLCPALDFCREIAMPVEWEPETLESLGLAPERVLLDLPRAAFGRERQLREMMEKCMAAGFSRFLCGNLGMVQLCRELGAEAHGGPFLNITNTAALEKFARLGLRSAELSMELSGRGIARLGGSMERGVTVYGRQALMLTRNCPLANAPKGCRRCKSPGTLTDRKGVRFPVVCRQYGGYGVELLNSVPVWLGDQKLDGADFAVLRFTVENPVEISQVVEAFQRGGNPGGDYTRGLFRRGVE